MRGKLLSDELFWALVENSYDGVALVGADGERIYVSPAFMRFVGYTSEEFAEVKPFEVVHPEDRPAISEAFQAAAQGTGSVEVRDIRLRHKDGSLRYGEATISNRLGDPQIRALVINWRDITDRKRAQEKLNEALERLQSIIEGSPLAILTLDRDRKVVSWNPAAEQMFGWKGDEVIGRPYPLVPEEERESFEHLISRELEGQTFTAIETQRLRRDGSLVDVTVSAAPVRTSSGEIEGVMTIIVDETKRKRAEDDLRRSLEALRKTDDERRQLLARLVTAQEEERRRIASEVHDDSIQVMTAVNLRLQMITRELGDHDQAGKLAEIGETVEKASRRLRHLIFELNPPALTRHGLSTALAEYLEQLQEDAGLHFQLQNELEMEPPVNQRIVAYRIAQEALTNVRKHARANGVEVFIGPLRNGVLVRVRDDGVGFNLDDALDRSRTSRVAEHASASRDSRGMVQDRLIPRIRHHCRVLDSRRFRR